MSTAQNLAPVVIARRCESSFPAAWLDAADLGAEHDPRDALCLCDACDADRRSAVRALSERWLAKFAANDNAEHERSQRPTIRVPKLTVCTNERE